MFGFSVGREWAAGERPSLAAHVAGARRARDALLGGGPSPPFAFQVFLAGPRRLKFSVDAAEAADLRRLLAASPDLWGIAHGTYLDSPWDPAAPSFAYRCSFIRKELRRAGEAGLAGLVIHLGIPPPAAVARVLPRLLPREGEEEPPGAAGAPRIFLEVPHVLPAHSHYETPEKLAALFRLVDRQAGGHRFGLCIDTAHLWACGADLSSFASAEAWLARLRAVRDVIPPERIVFHLNDNSHPCGAGLDRHEPLLRGAIWGEYLLEPAESGLAAFLQYAREHRVPTVLERRGRAAPGDDQAAEKHAALLEALGADYAALQALGFGSG